MSALADAAGEYLALRHALGHELEEAGRLLPRFAAFAEAAGAETVTLRLALDWAGEAAFPPGSTVPGRRMTAVRGFARYLAGVNPATEVPPPGIPGYPARRHDPYIYSPADITALTTQAAQMIRSPMRAATISTIIGLLDTTGLRIGEALSLERRDISWAEGVLTIRESKFGKSRLVPVHDSTTAALGRYARTRDRLLPDAARSTPCFFATRTGTKILYADFRNTFAALAAAAGIGDDSPARPRIHGIRHTFAVRALQRWYRDGADVQARLPWLSAYLGHREPRYTYRYLTAVPELLTLAAARLEHAAGRNRP